MLGEKMSANQNPEAEKCKVTRLGCVQAHSLTQSIEHLFELQLDAGRCAKNGARMACGVFCLML